MSHIVLIGHRAAGKSVTGTRLAAALDRAFVDLDARIEQARGRSAAELVREDVADFRRTEIDTLEELCREEAPMVIAAGGGIEAVPDGVRVLWLDRDGWDDAARTSRERLRPDMTWDEEVSWMRATREPRYAAMAHMRLRLERDCPEEEAAARAAELLRWSMEVASGGGFRSTWLVPRTASELRRGCADVRMFGLAGVEVRSDLHPDAPTPTDVPVLASLRNDDRTWFTRHSTAAVFDCDVQHIGVLQFDGLTPRPLLVSSHPHDVDPDDVTTLAAAARTIAERWPEWEPFITLKYAPVVKSWIELRVAYECCRVYRKRGGRVTFLPQGRRWHWMRALQFRTTNEYNYIRTGSGLDGTAPPPLQYFLPLAVGPVPDIWCGLIGDPVHRSAGPLWHRARSLATDGGRVGYLPIPLGTEEREPALFFLLKLGIHGLSVTSPLKNALLPSVFVTSPDKRTAGNTLTHRNGGWELTDTDETGLRACLAQLRSEGVTPGPVAIMGQGGVLTALERACAIEGWIPIRSYSARLGWQNAAERPVRLVIDASGSIADHHDAPACEAWLDLSYVGCSAPPAGVRVYRTGRCFFEAQAAEQWKRWGLE